MRNIHLLTCVAAAVVAVAGCSAHEQPPTTPDVRAAIPTNRATINSWELAMGQVNVRPGYAASSPVALVPRARLDQGFEPSDPAAVAVYTALVRRKLETKYIATAAKDGTVLLEGVVSDDSQKAIVAQIAAAVPGVKKVVNDLKISKEPPQA
jgi:hypothetical protein